DRTMVTISLGSAAGLKEGDTLHVYRREPKAEYLGKLRVVIVEANAAVGRLQEGVHGEVRLGDRVSGSLDKSAPSSEAKAAWLRQPLTPAARAVAFSPDGRRLATAEGNIVRLWDAATGRILSQSVSDQEIAAVAFSPDRKLLATGGRDRSVLLWDVLSGK